MRRPHRGRPTGGLIPRRIPAASADTISTCPSSARPAYTQHDSRLCSLPLEIRHIVYRYLCCGPDPTEDPDYMGHRAWHVLGICRLLADDVRVSGLLWRRINLERRAHIPEKGNQPHTNSIYTRSGVGIEVLTASADWPAMLRHLRQLTMHCDEVESLARYRPRGRPALVQPSDGVAGFIADVPLLDMFTVKRQDVLEPGQRGLTSFCCTEDDVTVLIHAASDDHGDAFQALRTVHTRRFKLQILLHTCEPGEGEPEYV
jgi:hypothetical protein